MNGAGVQVHSELGVESRAPGQNALETVALSKAFGGVKAVDSVSLVVREHAISALIGPNGAGKTTLFNIVTGRARADSGHVRLFGRDITGLPVSAIARRGIARSFQDLRLFGTLTALENVNVYALGPAPASIAWSIGQPWRQVRADRKARQRSLEVLSSLGIDELRDTPAKGLTFAQQKLVALARLLVTEPKVVLLDEPASGLDERERDELMAVVRTLGEQGRTVCFVEHNIDVVRGIADWVYFLAEGRLVREGPPEEIFRSAELAEVYFGVERAANWETA